MKIYLFDHNRTTLPRCVISIATCSVRYVHIDKNDSKFDDDSCSSSAMPRGYYLVGAFDSILDSDSRRATQLNLDFDSLLNTVNIYVIFGLLNAVSMAIKVNKYWKLNLGVGSACNRR